MAKTTTQKKKTRTRTQPKAKRAAAAPRRERSAAAGPAARGRLDPVRIPAATPVKAPRAETAPAEEIAEEINEGKYVYCIIKTQTPVGFVPTQIDYSDYRDVAGVKMPFRRKVSQTYMQMTIELSDVQPNVPIDAARFARPVPRPAA